MASGISSGDPFVVSSPLRTAMGLWQVVGGAEKKGILVRRGQDLKSELEELRLATGATARP